MGKLQGKVALVTGSGRNIGRATVLHLAREGAHVIVNARSNQAEAGAVVRDAQALGVRAISIIADIAKKDSTSTCCATLSGSTRTSRLPPIQILEKRGELLSSRLKQDT